MVSPTLNAMWKSPGLFSGTSGPSGPTSITARSWWLPRVKNVIGGASMLAATFSPRTSV